MRIGWGFNHPMVKVKERAIDYIIKAYQSFNHPMVKVKVIFF